MLIVDVVSAANEDTEVAEQSEPGGPRGQAEGLLRRDTNILNSNQQR